MLAGIQRNCRARWFEGLVIHVLVSVAPAERPLRVRIRRRAERCHECPGIAQ
jgi:hypothetical protein